MPELRIATRGSPLALAQAEMVRDLLIDIHGLDAAAIEIMALSTAGDRVQDRPLSEIGGKGLFTKEIEIALLERRADIAVHSMKDMATILPDGLTVAAMLAREDPRDAFISPVAGSLAALRPGSVVGTSSLRRQAQILRARPDLKVVGFRGNVETRLKKLGDKVADATFLALAGLRRLGLEDKMTAAVAVEDMLPAVAQGAIGIEIRKNDDDAAEFVTPLNDPATAIAVSAERAFLAALDGSCRTPIAGLAKLDGGTVSFRGMIITPDGRTAHEIAVDGARGDAEKIGREAGLELKGRGGPDFFAALDQG